MLKRRAVVTLFALAAITTVGSPALACGLMGDNFNLGLRASYGLPMGTAGDNVDFNDLTSGAIPVQIDLLYRFDESWQAGAYFAYGPTLIADDAKKALAASGLTDVGGHREQRVGIQALRSFRGESRVAPWVGVSGGYSWTRYAAAKTTDGKETEIGLGGFEAGVQLGANYKASERFSIGPFASVTFGQFQSHLTWLEDDNHSTSVDVKDKGTHEWVQLGVRTTFGM